MAVLGPFQNAQIFLKRATRGPATRGRYAPVAATSDNHSNVALWAVRVRRAR